MATAFQAAPEAITKWSFWTGRNGYFAITIQPGDHGMSIVITAWGREVSHPGGSNSKEFTTIEDATLYAEQIERRVAAEYSRIP